MNGNLSKRKGLLSEITPEIIDYITEVLSEKIDGSHDEIKSAITSTIKIAEGKVDKVEGKGLSTNDFTDADKTKLDSLENYDDTEVQNTLDTLESGKVDKVEGEGLSETKSVETYSRVSSMIDGTVTSPIRMPEIEDFIYIVSQDGRNSTLALYNSTQIDNIITSANAAFGTRISYKTITDDVFDETLNAGWYKITSADETKNYISTWMLVTRITNDYHTSEDVIPIARQIIFGEGSIKHRTYFGRVKQFEETIIQPWSIDVEEESGDVSTFAALPNDRTEYLDTYWSDWEISATQGSVDDKISDSIENKEDTANKVTVLSESSTDEEYPSAKAVYDYVEKGINPIVKAALEEITTVNTIYDLGVQTELVITLPSGQVGDFIQVDFISGSTATTLTVNSSSGIVGFDLIPAANTIYTLYFDWGVTGYDGTEVTYGWRFNYSEYSVDVV